MKTSLIKGFCFGLTSGVITTLGMMVGLHSGSGSKLVVLGGIISIAVADAFSDAFGVHVSEESGSNNGNHVWTVTISTFFSKLIFASTFIAPVIFFRLEAALWISIFWGLFALTVLSLYLAKVTGGNKLKVVGEHLTIALIVIISTHFLGDLINKHFN